MRLRHVEPYPHTYQTRVPAIWLGRALLDFYREKFPYRSSQEWQVAIERGEILLNGQTARPEARLQSSDLLEHRVPSRVEPAVPDEIVVVKKTEEILAVVKPAPMPVHPCGRFLKNSLQYILEERGEGPLFPVHRLDLLTSGLVVFGRTSEVAADLCRLFQVGQVEKSYVALVSGEFPAERMIQAPIRRKESYLFECHPDGRPAKTGFRRLWSSGGKSLVECRPMTGRTHQIRLHLREAGYPIWNDPYYGPDSEGRCSRRLYSDAAIALHAWRYAWGEITLEAPIPLWAGQP